MKPTDFAEHLMAFLTNWLTKQRNASPKTIHSYRHTSKLLLKYCQEREHIFPVRTSRRTFRTYHFQKVIAIPVKKAGKPVVEHLTPEAMKLLLDST